MKKNAQLSPTDRKETKELESRAKICPNNSFVCLNEFFVACTQLTHNGEPKSTC